MNELTKIQKEIRKKEKELKPLHKKRDKLRDAKNYKANSKYIGKCYTYRNSYGTPAEGWWLYTKVKNIKPDGTLTGLTFQKESLGKIEIETDAEIHFYLMEKEIPEEILKKEYAKIMKELEKVKP